MQTPTLQLVQETRQRYIQYLFKAVGPGIDVYFHLVHHITFKSNQENKIKPNTWQISFSYAPSQSITCSCLTRTELNEILDLKDHRLMKLDMLTKRKINNTSASIIEQLINQLIAL